MRSVLDFIQNIIVRVVQFFASFRKVRQVNYIPNPRVLFPEFFYSLGASDVARRQSLNTFRKYTANLGQVLFFQGIARKLPSSQDNLPDNTLWNNEGYVGVSPKFLAIVDETTWRTEVVTPGLPDQLKILVDLEVSGYSQNIPDANVPFGTIQLFINGGPSDMTQIEAEIIDNPVGQDYLEIRPKAGFQSIPEGEYTVEILNNDYIKDAASPLLDRERPVVDIGNPVPVDVLVIPGTVEFTYQVTCTGADSINLTPGDITLNPTGTANGVVTVQNGNTANPIITITNVTGAGTLRITIGPGIAVDDAGNTSREVTAAPANIIETALLQFSIHPNVPVTFFHNFRVTGGPEEAVRTVNFTFIGNSGYGSYQASVSTQVLDTPEDFMDRIIAQLDGQIITGSVEVNVQYRTAGVPADGIIFSTINATTGLVNFTVT